MSLSPTQTWKDTAAAGEARPVLLFEFKPTVLYDEKNFRGDWAEGSSVSDLDLDHPTDELRLETTEIVSAAKQEKHQAERHFFVGTIRFPGKSGVTEPIWMLSAAQTVKFSTAFKLEKLYLGLENEGNHYKAGSKISILTNFRSLSKRPRVDSASTIAGIFAKADVIDEIVIDHSLDGESADDGGPTFEVDSKSRKWRVFDYSQKNIWMPGSNTPCAIVISANNQNMIEYLKLRVGSSRSDYVDGQFYLYNSECSKFLEPDQSMAFKFEGLGYEETGSGVWSFDVGAAPGDNDVGELELRHVEPPGTSLVFRKRESSDNATWGDWAIVSDSSSITRRYVQLEVSFKASSDKLQTPRVFSMRAVYRRSVKFLMASRPLFGYPHLVAEAPDYSAEGDPLSGAAKTTDTSRIVMLDPGGMLSNLFGLYNLQNDEIIVSLGFDADGFLETDYLPFKTIWIEDWAPADGQVIVQGYDQQVLFKEAQAPTPDDPPEQTEEIHFSLMNPADIKRELLRRARIRPSRIDAASFAALESAFDWQLSHVIEGPTGLQKVDQELNKHLLAFQIVNESGRWAVRYVDFSASAAATLDSDDPLAGSERYYPGWRFLRNVVVVLYGGVGQDDKEYRGLSPDFDEASKKAHKTYSADKLHSEFIPATEDARSTTGAPMTVARRRLNLQKDGVRTIEFSTHLKFAYLQIGDHINLTSSLYSRPGADSPNPLLVMILRKNIDSNLGAVHWTGLILLDAEQSEGSTPTVEPPQNVTVTVGGDGSVSWAWDASADDTGAANQQYELFQRLSHLDAWGTKKLTKTATGAADYSQSDSDFSDLVAYDFGVRFVDSAGRASAIVTVENRLLTDVVPSAPAVGEWGAAPLPGQVEIYTISDVSGAHHYNVYSRVVGSDLWVLCGSIPTGLNRRDSFIFTPPNPYSSSGRWIGFRLRTVDKWSQESVDSAVKIMTYIPLMTHDEALSAPTFGNGTYPLISREAIGPHQGFTITLKILAPSGEEDKVDRYEMRRRNDGGTDQASWSDWQSLPDCLVKQEDDSLPAPRAVFYDNTDKMLKPTWYYQYQARAIGKNNVPGAWSSSDTVQLTEDTTGPDQPTITVTNHVGVNIIQLSKPAISGGSCPDFSHAKIEGNENGAGWQILDEHYADLTFVHSVDESDLEVNWSYRVTYYDHSGNASTTSAASANKKHKKATKAFLSSAITWSGNELHVTSSTVFDSDVEIQGVLKAAGGIKTSTGSERIELGNLAGNDRLSVFIDGTERGILRSDGNNCQLEINSKSGNHNAIYHHRLITLKYLTNTEAVLGVGGAGGGYCTVYKVGGNNWGSLQYDKLTINNTKVVGTRQTTFGAADTSNHQHGYTPITLTENNNSGSADIIPVTHLLVEFVDLHNRFNELEAAYRALAEEFNKMRTGAMEHGLYEDS